MSIIFLIVFSWFINPQFADYEHVNVNVDSNILDSLASRGWEVWQGHGLVNRDCNYRLKKEGTK